MQDKPRSRDGQTLVEFALIAPVVFLLMLAIISFGLIFSWWNTLNNAAREGARAGAVSKTDEEIRQLVTRYSSGLPHADTVAIAISATDANGAELAANQRRRGGAITVKLTYTADVVAIPGILSNQKTLIAQSTFRMESDAP